MADRAAAGFRLDHVGLAVADLAAARSWYCDVFGLEPELTLRVESLDLSIEMLIHPECGYRLELLHRPGSTATAKPGSPGDAALREGYGHLAFDVDDLGSAYDRAVARGARPVMPPGPSPEAGVRMAFVADPEDNLIEMLHRPGAGFGEPRSDTGSRQARGPGEQRS